MTRVNADIDALKDFHAALVRYRYGQRGAVDRDGDRIEAARAALAEKADRWRAELDRCRAEYEDCRQRDDDCSRLAQAVAEAEQRLERIRIWQSRVDEEAIVFHDVRGRFRDLLDYDLPRSESHLTTLITRLEAASGTAEKTVDRYPLGSGG